MVCVEHVPRSSFAPDDEYDHMSGYDRCVFFLESSEVSVLVAKPWMLSENDYPPLVPRKSFHSQRRSGWVALAASRHSVYA